MATHPRNPSQTSLLPHPGAGRAVWPPPVLSPGGSANPAEPGSWHFDGASLPATGHDRAPAGHRPATEEALADAEPYAAPDAPRTVIRKIDVFVEELPRFLSRIQKLWQDPNGIHVFIPFTSTAEPSGTDLPDGNVSDQITLKSGVFIAGVSMSPQQREVLLGQNLRFRVKQVLSDAKRIQIELKEIAP